MKIQTMAAMAGSFLVFGVSHSLLGQAGTTVVAQTVVHHVRVQPSRVKALGMSRLQERGSSLTVRTLDAKGNLVKLVEPDVSGKPAFTTEIAYDAAGKVTSITQRGAQGDAPRVRTFLYDAQERITSASSPEAGKTTYTYDAAGNLATKTDARGTTITYTWDASKRLVAKQYTDNTPAHNYICSAGAAAPPMWARRLVRRRNATTPTMRKAG